MVVKIAVTALLALLISATHLANMATNRAFGPEGYQINKWLYNSLKAIAIVSLWTLVGCGIAAVWIY